MFSKSTEYALRAAIYIAQKGSEEKKIGIEEISKAIGSPRPFTAKILQSLTKDKIIHSITGPHGGFYMTGENKNLPVCAVLDAMGEGKFLDQCVLGLPKCSEAKPCPMHSKYKIIKKQLNDLFETETINQLANGVKAGNVYMKLK